MPIFLDTRGQPTLMVGICGRCSRKLPLAQLFPDLNAPGLMVCKKDLDQFDPYRLPARAPDKLNGPFVRPDISLVGLPGTLAVLPQSSGTVRDLELDDAVRITEDGLVRITERPLA